MSFHVLVMYADGTVTGSSPHRPGPEAFDLKLRSGRARYASWTADETDRWTGPEGAVERLWVVWADSPISAAAMAADGERICGARFAAMPLEDALGMPAIADGVMLSLAEEPRRPAVMVA